MRPESLHVRLHPVYRRMLEHLCIEDGRNISDKLRDLIEAEYRRRHPGQAEVPEPDPDRVKIYRRKILV